MSEKKELKEEQLEKVNGGWGDDHGPAYFCPHCGSDDSVFEQVYYGVYRKTCNECGTIWEYDVEGNITKVTYPEQYEDPKKALENLLKLKSDLDKRLRGKK